MTKEISTGGFDYSALDKDVRGKLLALAGQVKRHGQAFVKSVMETGEAIHEAHELFAGNGGDGHFSKWIESETGLSRTTAYDWMNVFRRSKDCPIIGQFPPTVALTLAATSVPDAAIKDFAKQVDKGMRPTVARAKEWAGKFREKIAATTKPTGDKPAPKPKTDDAKPEEPTKPEDDGPLNDEPEKELTFEEQVKKANGQIESFCRQLTAFYKDNCPKLQSIDYMGRYDSAEAQIKAACGTLRTCKYQEQPCPKCKGEGCSTCAKESDFGGVSVLTYRQLAG